MEEVSSQATTARVQGRTKVREIARRPIAAIIAKNDREEVPESPELYLDLGWGPPAGSRMAEKQESRAADRKARSRCTRKFLELGRTTNCEAQIAKQHNLKWPDTRLERLEFGCKRVVYDMAAQSNIPIRGPVRCCVQGHRGALESVGVNKTFGWWIVSIESASDQKKKSKKKIEKKRLCCCSGCSAWALAACNGSFFFARSYSPAGRWWMLFACWTLGAGCCVVLLARGESRKEELSEQAVGPSSCPAVPL